MVNKTARKLPSMLHMRARVTHTVPKMVKPCLLAFTIHYSTLLFGKNWKNIARLITVFIKKACDSNTIGHSCK